MPAAHDGAHVVFIMPRHCSHKSCIAPHSWGKCSSSYMHQVSLRSRWPPSLVPLSLTFAFPIPDENITLLYCFMPHRLRNFYLDTSPFHHSFICFFYLIKASHHWCHSVCLLSSIDSSGQTTRPLAHCSNTLHGKQEKQKPDGSISSPFIQSGSPERQHQKVYKHL